MRYAIFTDIHANLEALTAVLAKIDELAEQEPVDAIWFLGDLVGYGPNPNECIDELRKRTDIIIAGNHDWAAVGKIDLEDFSSAARTSAEWTAEQLTEEHRTFLKNLPERIERDDFTLVHGSPYGPLWEYLTSEVLAERSFEYFSSRYCIVGHTHVPVIFQQPDSITQIPTAPLTDEEEEETQKIVAVSINKLAEGKSSALGDSTFVKKATSDNEDTKTERDADKQASDQAEDTSDRKATESDTSKETDSQVAETLEAPDSAAKEALQETLEESAENAGPASSGEGELVVLISEEETADEKEKDDATNTQGQEELEAEQSIEQKDTQHDTYPHDEKQTEVAATEHMSSVEDRLNSEIAELLELLGLSQSMVKVTNEMLIPPEGAWSAPTGYRAIVNPGGVGQPRDGDPRAAFMIYDTAKGFTFYRIHYDYEKTQEKILEAGLPAYLATRLGYGR